MRPTETTSVLGNRTDENQKAFIDLLRAEAIHIGYVMLPRDCMSARDLFRWKLTTCDERAYSLNSEDYPILPLFTRRPPTIPLLFSTHCFGLCLTSLVRAAEDYVATVLLS